MLAEALARDPHRYAEAWNFGPADADAVPVSDVVESLGRYWGIEKAWVKDDASHAPEEDLLRLDSTKAARLLNWRARLPIHDALRWVAEWYRDFHAGREARALCDEQIASYGLRKHTA